MFLALGQEMGTFAGGVLHGENYGIQNPTEQDLRTWIEKIAANEWDLAILYKDDDSYVQTAGGIKKGTLMLEYQDGSIDEHYRATGYPTTEDVIAAFTAYLRGDGWWEGQFIWERMSF
jgi:hypothetical protein